MDLCGHCEYCCTDIEQFCEVKTVFSFNSPDKYLGGATFGGFLQSIVTNENYVLHLPNSLDPAAAAPLLCVGITVYSPLRHWQAGPGKKVSILGIGGLGHLAINIAKAMGAHVVVFTTSPDKVADIQRLGTDEAMLSSSSSIRSKVVLT